MFDCPNCKSVASKLICSGDGLKCPNCYCPSTRMSGANYHNKAGLRGKAKNLTEVAKAHIWDRTVSNDGKTVISRSSGKTWRW